MFFSMSGGGRGGRAGKREREHERDVRREGGRGQADGVEVDRADGGRGRRGGERVRVRELEGVHENPELAIWSETWS